MVDDVEESRVVHTRTRMYTNIVRMRVHAHIPMHARERKDERAMRRKGGRAGEAAQEAGGGLRETRGGNGDVRVEEGREDR